MFRNGPIVLTMLFLSGLTGAKAQLSPGEPNYDTCLTGRVWRDAFPSDHMCVTPDEREEVSADNAAASSRTIAAVGDQCRIGFVWRKALPGDKTCVTRDDRDAAKRQNAAAASHTGALSTGPNQPLTCRSGYVWRQAVPRDFVCVTPAERIQAKQQNAEAPGHRGSDACIAGFVWREARPLDLVCVTPERRDKAKAQNNKGFMFYLRRECNIYADTALDQINEATARLCGFTGDRWIPSRQAHFNWCFARNNANERNGEFSGRKDNLENDCGGTNQPPTEAARTVDAELMMILPNGRTELRVTGKNFPYGHVDVIVVHSTVVPGQNSTTASSSASAEDDFGGSFVSKIGVTCTRGAITTFMSRATGVDGVTVARAGASC